MLIQSDTLSSPWHTFTALGNSLLDKIPMLIFVTVFMVIIFMLSGVVKKIASKIMRRKSGNQAVATVMASFISIIFIFIGIFIALSILGLNQTVSSLLAGAGILGLVLGLALQDSLSSAIAGIIMTTRKSYKVGDFVESNGFQGTIVEINLRNTTVRRNDGVEVKIPNKLVLNNPLINYSLRKERRVEITVSISYDADLVRIEKILREAIANTIEFNKEKPVDVFFTEFGSSAIHVLIRFWIPKYKQSDFLLAQSDGIRAVKNAFDANGIIIPYPVHVVQTKQ